MSIASTTTRPTPEPIAVGLRRLRRQLNGWLLIEGFSRLLLCVALVIAVDVLLDWTFNLDRGQRAVMLILACAAVGVVFHRFLIRPWLSHLSDDALCLEIEKRNQHLGESLISALQLARSTGVETQGVSSSLIGETIHQGVLGAEEIAFEQILHQRRRRANATVLSLAALAVAGSAAAVVATQPMRTWFERNVLLKDREWPSHTFFEFAGAVDAQITIPFGSNWPLVVRMVNDQAELPAAVDIDLITSHGRRTERTERLEPSREFRLMLKHVTEPFQLRARSGRSRTAWHQVRLVKRPATEKLTLQMTPPAYSGLEPRELREGEGPYYFLAGSKLAVGGSGSKALSSATLVAGQTRHAMKISDERQFHLDLSPEQVIAGTYHVVLEDTEAIWTPGSNHLAPLVSHDQTGFTLKNSPDLAPSVKAQLVGIGNAVVPNAQIPYTCQAEDDFGMTHARLRYQWRAEGAQAGNNTGQSPLAVLPNDTRQTAVSFERILNLAELEVPAGSGFSFEIEVDDNDNVSGPKTGKSNRFLLRVVTEDELRAELLRREKELRQEFQSVLKRQEDQRTESQALLAGARSRPDVTAPQRKALMETQRRQKLLVSDLTSIVDRLAAIMIEVRNNRLEEANGPVQQRLGDQIIRPMRTLADQSLPAIVRSLDRVRRQLNVPGERDDALVAAIDQQDQAIEVMREILRFMIKSEGFQEAVNLLYQVQQAQRNVADLTDQEKRQRVERILNDTTTPDSSMEEGNPAEQ